MDEELTAAPAAPVVLTVLSEGESYGYEILKRVRELSEGEFAWTDAMVYPLFHRLTQARLPDDGVANAARGAPPQLLRDNRPRPDSPRKAARPQGARHGCS